MFKEQIIIMILEQNGRFCALRRIIRLDVLNVWYVVRQRGFDFCRRLNVERE